jgi:hypothetical protein
MDKLASPLPPPLSKCLKVADKMCEKVTDKNKRIVWKGLTFTGLAKFVQMLMV